MAILSTLITSPISTGSFVKLCDTALDTDTRIPTGKVTCYFRNDNATAVNVVFNAADATGALTEFNDFRYFSIPGSSTVLIPFAIDPSTTFIRSSGAAHNSVFVIMQW
jgi:hypothetical protein